MEMAPLRVVHLSKTGSNPQLNSIKISELQSFFDLRIPGALAVDTCQRKIWVDFQGIGEPEVMSLQSLKSIESVEVLQGAEAYCFLLQIATGLESQVQGETDIFGQLKQAWAQYELNQGPYFQLLAPWIQRLFEDTKEIRSQYLQHLGGSSYGSLVRKIIKQYATPESAPLLIVGAGNLARSVAPWVIDHELLLWNRSVAGLDGLIEQLKSPPAGSMGSGSEARYRARAKARYRKIVTDKELADAWRDAAHVIVCIPLNELEDAERIALWKRGLSVQPWGRSVIHLGGLRADSGRWNALPNFHPLDDVFALEKHQQTARLDRIARAKKACDEKARLRMLSGRTLPHGWEDLAVFA